MGPIRRFLASLVTGLPPRDIEELLRRQEFDKMTITEKSGGIVLTNSASASTEDVQRKLAETKLEAPHSIDIVRAHTRYSDKRVSYAVLARLDRLGETKRAEWIRANFPDSANCDETISRMKKLIEDVLAKTIEREKQSWCREPNTLHFDFEKVGSSPGAEDRLVMAIFPAVVSLAGWDYLGSKPDYDGPLATIARVGYTPTREMMKSMDNMARSDASNYFMSKREQVKAGTYIETSPY